MHQGEKTWRSLAQNVATLWFPAKCLICQDPVMVAGAAVCTDCQAELDAARCEVGVRHTNYCPSCGEPNSGGWEQPGTCLVCQLFPLGVDTFSSIWYYSEPFVQLLKKWKYAKQELIGTFFSDALCKQLAKSEWCHDIERVVSIPSAPSQTRRRGFYPLRTLGRAASRFLKCPYSPLSLRLPNNHIEQSKTPLRKRVQNMNGMITAALPMPAANTILLIDDVVTSGASIEAASLALKQLGVSKIHLLTLARSQRFTRLRLHSLRSRNLVEGGCS